MNPASNSRRFYSSVAAVIPTYGRGQAVLDILDKIERCEPRAAEILVHIDAADGSLEERIKSAFPRACVMSSSRRVGPGGGRHLCLMKCESPYAASFDDDSYPVDQNFFGDVERIFSEQPDAAVLAAAIWHSGEPIRPKSKRIIDCANFVGCGAAVRLSAYRAVRGYLPRPVAYGMEEADLSLQLFAAGWRILETDSLRVFHDTDRKHHDSAEITGGQISNVALGAFLNYPLAGWGWASLQLGNAVLDAIKRRRFRGILSGLSRIPIDCYRYRAHRNPVRLDALRRFRRLRRASAKPQRTENERSTGSSPRRAS